MHLQGLACLAKVLVGTSFETISMNKCIPISVTWHEIIMLASFACPILNLK